MNRATYILVVISLLIGLLGVVGCGESNEGITPAEGATPNDELLDLYPEEVLGNLFSLEFESQHEQNWEQFEGKRVEWRGRVYNKEGIDGKVAVSLEYAYQSSPLAHRNLRAGVIIYLNKSEAMDLTPKVSQIAYTGHLVRRLSWTDKADALELLTLGYTGASAVTIEDGRLVE